MDWKKDSEKAKNSAEGSIERGTERVKKAFDSDKNNLEHDAKIEASKAKEDMKNHAADLKQDVRDIKDDKYKEDDKY